MPKRKHNPLILLKQKKIVERWYYWTEIKRIRFDDAIKNLEQEFFIKEARITRIINMNQSYFEELQIKNDKNATIKKNQTTLQV